MAEQTKHNNRTKRRRWPWVALLLLVLFVVGARLSLRSSFVHNVVRGQLEQLSSGLVNGKLEIEKVEGDLWKELALVDVNLSTPDTVFKADTLYARYQLLSYFQSEFLIDQVRTVGTGISINERKDGTFNFQNLLKSTPEEDTTTSDPFYFSIERFSIVEGSIRGQFRSLGKDSLIIVRDLNLEGALGYRGDQYDLQLREMGFRIDHTRLPPVNVSTAGRATDQEISLEKLVIGTGRSVLKSSALVNIDDSTTAVTFNADPLAWRDLSAVVVNSPVQQDLQLDLSLNGTLSDFELKLEAESDALQEFTLSSGFAWNETLELKRAQLSARQLDLATLMSDTTYPQIGSLSMDVEGELDFANIEPANLEGSFSLSELHQNSYRIDQLSGSYSLAREELKTDFNIERGKEQLNTRFTATGIWNGAPSIQAEISASNIQPAYWMNDPVYEGNLNFEARLDGKGYDLGDEYWSYQLEFKDSEIGGQPLSTASFRGQINSSRITTRSKVKLKESEMMLQAEVRDYLDFPAYTYEMDVNRLNLAEYRGLEKLPSAINANISGEGKFTTPEKLQLSSTIRIDSSVVNREFIKELSADIQIRDTSLTVSDGRLQSAIADGSFNARFHLLEWYDIGNRVDLDFQVKDIQSFAAIAGVETMQTSGEFSGRLRPVSSEELQFAGSFELKDLVYGDLVNSETMQGNMEILLLENPEFDFNLNLHNPVVNSVVLQDFETTIRAKMEPDSTYGNVELMFSSPNNSRIQHFGIFGIGSERASLRTMDLQIISELRRLSLQKPFDIEVGNQSFRMDTLRLSSGDGALIEAAIPYADSTTQQGYLLGRNCNLTVIQNTLLNESYFEGILSGRIYIDRRNNRLSSTGDMQIEQLVYNGAKLDSLDLSYEIQNERLEGGLLLYDNAERLVRGQLRVPFKLGDPNTFDESFFEENVFGTLEMKESAIERFEQLLTNAGVTNTSGLVKLNGQLRGTAGQPEMDAYFRLRNASISGVAVDSVRAAIDYNHTEKMLQINGAVTSLKQEAADITAQVPVQLDLKDFNIILPDEEDSIRVDIATNQFNLASLNDFVDRTEIGEVQGRLDGEVSISGPMEQLTADGKLNFRDGAVRVVETGVKFTQINSTISFRGNEVLLEQVKVRSGNGTFTASGTMDLTELTPGALDIKMVAENFRIANTPQYSAIIDMDTQLDGTLFKPNLNGKLSFVSGYIYLQNFGEKSVEAVQLDSATTTGYDYYMQYDSLSLNMDISFNRRFYVRNRRFLDLEYELDGQIDMLKNRSEDLQLFGTLVASSGYSRPLGKRFQLEEGTITFQGNPANPMLNIRHLFEPPQQELGDVRIWYIIEGTVENPQFKYESEPPMGLEDIISYTLFGKPFLSLEPWKQVVANSGSNVSAADVAMDVLLDKVETLATQQLGIDVVQIDNTRRGSTTGTSIKTGWYLNPKVFFAIQNEITGSTPDTIFILEYLLQKNLKLIITQGSDSQAGLDIRWNYDY